MFVPSRRFVVGLWLFFLGLVSAASGFAPSSAGATGISGLLLDTAGTQPQRGRVVLRLTVGAAEVVTARAGGNIRKGGHAFRLRPAKATVAASRRAALELRPRKGWQERKILGALQNGKTLIAKVRVRCKDFFGNKATRTLRIRLT